MQLTSIISLLKLGKVGKEKARNEILNIINSLNSLKKFSPNTGEFSDNTYFYNYYSLKEENQLEPTFNKFISSIDNANLLASLIVVREAFPQLSTSLNKLINQVDLSFFYDNSKKLMLGGYTYNSEEDKLQSSNFHYGVLNTEARLISYLAIGKGDLSSEEITQHWNALGRFKKRVDGIDVMASFGGSLFEGFFPTIYINEKKLNPDSFGLSFEKQILIQKLQAIEKGYPVWGEAPAYNDIYEYEEFGSKSGINPYDSESIIAPYASFLTLNAIGEGGKNLETIETLYPETIKGENGVIDSIDLETDLGIHITTSLVQGMPLAVTTNYLNGGIRNLFMDCKEMQKVIPFIKKENFFSKQEIKSEMDRVHEKVIDNLDKGNWRKTKVYLDYLNMLTQEYNQQERYKDLEKLNADVEELFKRKLSELYKKGQEQLNSGSYRSAIKTFKLVLGGDLEYKNAVGLLGKAREKRDAQVLIPKVEHLVTDFEQGARPNQIVEKIGPVEGPGSEINMNIVEGEVSHGRVMQIEYDVKNTGFCGMFINTAHLNLDKNDKIGFDIKGDENIGVPDKIKIELHSEDSSWPYSSIEITNIDKNWTNLEFSLSQLQPEISDNFNLKQIAIMIEGSKVSNKTGGIYLDNLYFN